MVFWIDLKNLKYGAAEEDGQVEGLHAQLGEAFTTEEAEQIFEGAREYGSVLVMEDVDELVELMEVLERLSLTFTFALKPPARVATSLVAGAL